MGNPIEVETGKALRRARLSHGYTLKQVADRSNGAFKPTAVAGYERAERSISLERLSALCAFYGLAPEIVLTEVMAAARRHPDTVVDLTAMESRAHTTPTRAV